MKQCECCKEWIPEGRENYVETGEGYVMRLCDVCKEEYEKEAD